MKKCVALLFCLFAIFGQPIYAAGQASPPQKTEDQDMPQVYKNWEQENAPREGAEDVRYGNLWSKTLMLLVVILLILFVGTWYLKRFGGLGMLKVKSSDEPSRIQILEKKILSPKAVIYLLQIDSHKVVLTETSSGIQVVQELSRQIKPFSLDPPTSADT